MAGTLKLPVLPNRPLISPNDKQTFGEILLRKNVVLGFTENLKFDPSLVVYDENYQNCQATSGVFREHMRLVAETLMKLAPRGSRLVEVGCGKGDFLKMIAEDGYFLSTGFDATYEGTQPYIQKRYLTTEDRIDAEIVALRHVLEHVPRPHEFLQTLRQVFGDTQIFIEVPDLEWIEKTGSYFDITYEHVNYFTQQSLNELFGGKVKATGRLFGDQYLYVVASLSDLAPSFRESYETSSSWETLDFDLLFPCLSSQVDSICRRAVGHRVFVWGAATKGCLFAFHWQRLASEHVPIDSVVDINPAKWGKYVPGTSVRIESPQDLIPRIRDDDLVVIANPNYEAEIIAELQKNCRLKVNFFTL